MSSARDLRVEQGCNKESKSRMIRKIKRIYWIYQAFRPCFSYAVHMLLAIAAVILASLSSTPAKASRAPSLLNKLKGRNLRSPFVFSNQFISLTSYSQRHLYLPAPGFVSAPWTLTSHEITQLNQAVCKNLTQKQLLLSSSLTNLPDEQQQHFRKTNQHCN